MTLARNPPTNMGETVQLGCLRGEEGGSGLGVQETQPHLLHPRRHLIGSGSEVVGDGVNVDFRGGGMVVISASNADFS